MKKLIAGNWKMFGTLAAAQALAQGIADRIGKAPELKNTCDFLVCPPAVHIGAVRAAIGGAATVGGQDCSARAEGAFTGEIAAPMLKDMGCAYVIVGHSERRQYHRETDELVAAKAAAAHKAGLIPIICVGESGAERDAGRQEAVVGAQLAGSLPAGSNALNTVIAYEPVWAIGTGKTATPADAASMHGFIRQALQEKLADSAKMRILYGGSVKPDNAAGLFAVKDIDGALIGGASLKAEDFIAIARAA
jgi:triosephosphate isomerase